MENGKQAKEKCIRINNEDIEKVNQFKYRDTTLLNNNNYNNISSAINHRIHRGTNSIMDCDIYRVSNLLRKGAKCKIYKTLIRTAVLYGCQS